MYLSPTSIDETIDYLKNKFIKERTQAIVLPMLHQILSDSVLIVKRNIRLLMEQRQSELSTGALEDSVVGIFDPKTGRITIRANAHYGGYVEFGTGTRGSSSPSIHASQHGWVYNLKRVTTGQPSGSFMLISSMEIRENMEDIFIQRRSTKG